MARCLILIARTHTHHTLQHNNQLLWPPTATEDDLARWHQQGFVLQEAPPFGLAQGHGGACDVLLLSCLRVCGWVSVDACPPATSIHCVR